MQDLETLIQGGALGLSLVILGILSYVVKKCLCITGDHIRHSTEVQTKLSEKIKQDIDVGKETLAVLRSLNGHK